MADVGGPVIADRAGRRGGVRAGGVPRGLTGQLYKQFALTPRRVGDPLGDLRADLHTAMCALALARRSRSREARPVARFFAGFNRAFERTRSATSARCPVMTRHALLVMLTFGVLLAAVWGLIAHAADRLVPPEDQGFRRRGRSPSGGGVAPSAPMLRWRSYRRSPARSLASKAWSISAASTLLTGQVASYNGTVFIRFKPWDQRKSPAESVGAIQRTLTARLNHEIKDANVLVLNLPPIRGLSTSGGFTFVLQDARLGTAQLSKVLHGRAHAGAQRKEIGFVFSASIRAFAQLEYVVDPRHFR